ncbi:MAG: transglycosylase SLT domain-containing protein [Candidatus Contendobacter sp.]|nr:transglycosylase SLT domain-containing protein [Candidatus Contendobacter sp.]
MIASERCLPTGVIGILSSLLLLVSCATAPPPRNVNDACAIFAEYGDWYPKAKAASRRWNVPIPVLLAIIHQESAFRSDAQPPRTWYLGFIPGSRPSSAYGYSQALEGTWDRYTVATGHRGADRDDFADAVDFTGWYVNETTLRTGIARSDAYRQYLAYHEGQAGFAKGTYRNKPWLLERAQKVSRQAARYGSQLARCESQLLARS